MTDYRMLELSFITEGLSLMLRQRMPNASPAAIRQILNDVVDDLGSDSVDYNTRLDYYTSSINNKLINLNLNFQVSKNMIATMIAKGQRHLNMEYHESKGLDDAAVKHLMRLNMQQSMRNDWLRYGGQNNKGNDLNKNNKNEKMSKNLKEIKGEKTGGDLKTTYSSQHYVPTVPQVLQSQRVETPCLFAENVTEGKQGRWQWDCNRTRVPGVKKCDLKRIESQTKRIVPMKCVNEYVNVVKGYDVNKKVITDDVTNNSVVQQQVIPNVERLATQTRVERSNLPSVPYVDMQRTDAMGNPLPMSSGRMIMENRSRPFTDLNGGNSNIKNAGSQNQVNINKDAGREAGDVTLPNARTVRHKEFQLTDQDLPSLMAPSLSDDYMPIPKEWETLDPLENSDTISFYAVDDYGSVRIAARQFGFEFPPQYLPFSHTEGIYKEYLQWLVSLDFNMRVEFPAYHKHVYDVVFDTIATCETYILATLGRLEAPGPLGKYFDRRDLFEGASRFESIMNPVLKVYAFTPPVEIWTSPLPMRYLAVPDVDNVAGYRASEATALQQLRALNNTIGRAANDGSLKDKEGQGLVLGLKYRTLNEAMNNDYEIVGIVEDELLSMLARLQYVHGYVINSNAPVFKGVTDILLDLGVRKYLIQGVTVKYLSSFLFESSYPDPFYRVPGLRKRQMSEAAKALSSSLGKSMSKSLNDKRGSKEMVLYEQKSKSRSRSMKSKSKSRSK